MNRASAIGGRRSAGAAPRRGLDDQDGQKHVFARIVAEGLPFETLSDVCVERGSWLHIAAQAAGPLHHQVDGRRREGVGALPAVGGILTGMISMIFMVALSGSSVQQGLEIIIRPDWLNMSREVWISSSGYTVTTDTMTGVQTVIDLR